MLRKGTRVRVANEEAMRTCAGVEIGDTGKIIDFSSKKRTHAHVIMDEDRSNLPDTPWSIPVEGLERINKR